MAWPSPDSSTALAKRVVEAGLSAGLDDVRIAAAEPFVETRAHIESRRAAGFFGTMRFTTARPDVSCDVAATLPGAVSLVVGAYGYWMPEPDPPVGVRFAGRIARFSWVDWYEGLRCGLAAAAEELVRSGFRARVLVDANQLVDRAAAARAGIGWFGKNTNVLHPRLGSWVLLGSVVTDAPLPVDPPSSGSCGTCSRCLPACPTGAFVAPGVLDARRCISWLLQSPGDIPRDLRGAVGTRVYGCDDCQDVCPPNHRAVRHGAVASATRGRGPGGEPPDAHADLEWMLSAADEDVLARFSRFYIPRRDVCHLRRNALVALGNLGNRDAVPLVRSFLGHEAPMLRSHAAWALGRLGGGAARTALEVAAARESDRTVKEEIAAALAYG